MPCLIASELGRIMASNAGAVAAGGRAIVDPAWPGISRTGGTFRQARSRAHGGAHRAVAGDPLVVVDDDQFGDH